MRVPIVAGNWKMNPSTLDESYALAHEIVSQDTGNSNTISVICPPFPTLKTVKELCQNSYVKIGAQNLHAESSGAFTGETPPEMIAELCDYVILGHSERRQLFAEDDKFIGAKVSKSLELGISPIFCVGETLEQRDSDLAYSVIEAQIKSSLSAIPTNKMQQITVAYEPIWAIGTGKAATPEIAQQMIAHIRDCLQSISNDFTSSQIRILYGGSVNAANAESIASQEDIDGALVGGASLKAEEFLNIIKAFSSI